MAPLLKAVLRRPLSSLARSRRSHRSWNRKTHSRKREPLDDDKAVLAQPGHARVNTTSWTAYPLEGEKRQPQGPVIDIGFEEKGLGTPVDRPLTSLRAKLDIRPSEAYKSADPNPIAKRDGTKPLPALPHALRIRDATLSPAPLRNLDQISHVHKGQRIYT